MDGWMSRKERWMNDFKFKPIDYGNQIMHQGKLISIEANSFTLKNLIKRDEIFLQQFDTN
jgi:hypothetical protein